MTEMKHETLAAALAAFQAELPKVAKGNQANAGQYSYRYADLMDVSSAALPLLGKHGLSFTARPTMTDHGFVLKYKLMHEGGEKEKGEYPLPGANTPPQQLGSAITYARRYALVSVTGVAPGGDDDDAGQAPAAESSPRGKRQPRQQQASAQSPAPEMKRPSKDWVAMGRAAESIDALRVVYEEADAAGELGADAGEGVAVGAVLRGLKTTLEQRAATETQGANWVQRASEAKTRPELRTVLDEAFSAGASSDVLKEIGAFEHALPPEGEDGGS